MTVMKQRAAWRGAWAAFAAGGLLAGGALAQDLATVPVVSGLAGPVFVTAPAGDTSRLFIVEQRSGTTGRLRIVNLPANTLNATPYLSISPVASGGEQGLLGLAFHPDFMQNGYFFVNYTRSAEAGVSAGSTVIARYRATGGNPLAATADPASAVVLLTIPQPDSNHNGGWIGFGPDGHLYIATGDGGCFNDVTCTSPNPPSAFPHVVGGNAQSLTDNLLGKMLRIDVDGADNVPGNDDDDGIPGSSTAAQYTNPADNPYVGAITGLDQIAAHGLRNPWRPAFDRQTGDLWIADVGQGAREEVSFVPAGTLLGRNFGWRCTEGTRCTGLSGCTCNGAGLTPPLFEYAHSAPAVGPTPILGCSITGGYVYRGSAIPCLRGHYIFADYCSGDIYSLRRSSSGALVGVTQRRTQLDPPGAQVIQGVTSFGEDAAGELYICDQNGGEVFRIVPGLSSGTDCNLNGVPDSCDILNEVSQDANANGVPDECECDGDFNQDGNVDQGDVDYLVGVVAGGPNPTGRDPDFNRDGNVDQGDVDALLNVVAGGACP